MSLAADAEIPQQATGGALSALGAALAYIGFGAVVVSAAWTTRPLADPGKYQSHMMLLLGLGLVAAALIGRRAFAAGASGRLLCGLGGAACLSLAVDPTLESIGSLAATLPMWVLDAYPGLATFGWIVAGLGAVLWWVGGGRAGEGGRYGWVAAACSIVLVLAALGVRQGLVAARYDIQAYQTGLLVWRIVETGAILVTAMSVCGGRGFRQWPMLLFGIGLAVHGARGFVGQPPE